MSEFRYLVFGSARNRKIEEAAVLESKWSDLMSGDAFLKCVLRKTNNFRM
jgi:hypothetical protein